MTIIWKCFQASFRISISKPGFGKNISLFWRLFLLIRCDSEKHKPFLKDLLSLLIRCDWSTSRTTPWRRGWCTSRSSTPTPSRACPSSLTPLKNWVLLLSKIILWIINQIFYYSPHQIHKTLTKYKLTLLLILRHF